MIHTSPCREVYRIDSQNGGKQVLEMGSNDTGSGAMFIAGVCLLAMFK
jgi:hypothetical protein